MTHLILDIGNTHSRIARAEGESGPLTLVRVRLHTGRTHQIRAQFSHRGLPLLGDIRYGSKAACSPALWAWRLCFRRPRPATGNPYRSALSESPSMP